jgi:hypothetical protein
LRSASFAKLCEIESEGPFKRVTWLEREMAYRRLHEPFRIVMAALPATAAPDPPAAHLQGELRQRWPERREVGLDLDFGR